MCDDVLRGDCEASGIYVNGCAMIVAMDRDDSSASKLFSFFFCFMIRPQLEEIFHVDEHFRVFCESDTSGLCGSAMSCN